MSMLNNSYYDILDNVLYTYLTFCRDFACIEGKSHVEIISMVNYDFEGMNYHPTEYLIHYTGLLSLCGNWHPETSQYFREKINQLIEDHGLKNLLSVLNETEYYELERDLKVLNLIS